MQWLERLARKREKNTCRPANDRCHFSALYMCDSVSLCVCFGFIDVFRYVWNVYKCVPQRAQKNNLLRSDQHSQPFFNEKKTSGEDGNKKTLGYRRPHISISRGWGKYRAKACTCSFEMAFLSISRNLLAADGLLKPRVLSGNVCRVEFTGLDGLTNSLNDFGLAPPSLIVILRTSVNPSETTCHRVRLAFGMSHPAPART